MPRRRRASSNVDPEAEGEANNTALSLGASSVATSTDESAPVFYNTSFSTYRVSPLYVGASIPLSDSRLIMLASRLRDVLVGDVVRGVDVGLEPSGEDGGLGRAGVLLSVAMGWVAVRDLLGLDDGEEHGQRPVSRDLGSNVRDEGERGPGVGMKSFVDNRALYITLQYEIGTYAAVILPFLSRNNDGMGMNATKGQESNGDGAFLNLPLLLLKVPASLKPVIIEFLSTTFDCRVSTLRLGTRSLVGSFEWWMQTASFVGRSSLAKNVVITLGFTLKPPESRPKEGHEADMEEPGPDQDTGLKSIDIIVPAGDLGRFLKAGSGAHASVGSGNTKVTIPSGLHEEGWAWRHQDSSSQTGKGREQPQPFTDALKRYLKAHLGLDMFHPSVHVTKIACEGFVMSDGRFKMLAPRHGDDGQRAAALQLLQGLTAKARITEVGG
jgi:hypothetical protein